MSLLDYLLAPREDHRGWKTPSEASRILFVMVVGSVSYWAWPITEGNIVMWAGTVMMVSTALLSGVVVTITSRQEQSTQEIDSFRRKGYEETP